MGNYSIIVLSLVILSVLLLSNHFANCEDASTVGYDDASTVGYQDDLSYNSFNNAYGNDFDNVPDGNYYDYIVVGCGQAGSTVAGRLAQSGRFRVLGIEGGGRTHRSLNGTDYVAAKYNTDNTTGEVTVDPKPWTRFDVPLFSPTIYTPPTPYTQYPMIWNGVPYPTLTAKILGGSGAHNGMLWSRYQPATINSWGVQGWSYNETLRYYKRSEDATGTVGGALNPSFHGFSGPIKVTDLPAGDPAYAPALLFKQACINIGLPNNTDFNGPTKVGCGFQVNNIRAGVRSAGASEFLPGPIKQGNLRLALNAVATKVLFTRRNGTLVATGVQYYQNGCYKTAYARKEIILTLGAVLTPKLLLLSGIGNATLLTANNIPVLVNNPNVGKNLAQNPLSIGVWQYRDNYTLPNAFGVSYVSTDYAVSQTGLWAGTGGFGYAYYCKNRTQNCVEADVGIGSNGAQFASSNIIYVDVAATKPKARGTVTINSADPFAPPIVDLVPTSEQSDVDSLVDGFLTLRRILKTYPASSVFASELVPGPAVVNKTDLEAYVRANIYPSAHWIGSARMGNLGDRTAVVDPQLRVLGVTGLRVGDPSIFPSTNAHTSAQAVLAAERCACFILGC